MGPAESFMVICSAHPLENLRHIQPLLIVSSLCSAVVTAWLTNLLVNAPENPHKWLVVLISRTPRKAFRVTCERLEKLPKGVSFSGALRRKISYDKQRKLLVLNGIMGQRERDELLGLSRDTSYQKAVEGLFKYSLERLLGRLIACEKVLDGTAFRATWVTVMGILWASLLMALVSLFWTPLAVVSYWLLLICIASILVMTLILIFTSLKANRALEQMNLDTVEKVIHVQSVYNKTLNNTAHELVASGLLKGF